MRCSNCNTENPTDQKFCGECGTRTAPAEKGTRRSITRRHEISEISPEGERKQLTVLFADLKGSLELLVHRDPEESQRLLDLVLQTMMEAIHHHEGTVNQAMGDGIMALFGAPRAQEDHAVRACLAGLRMQESVRRLSARSKATSGSITRRSGWRHTSPRALSRRPSRGAF